MMPSNQTLPEGERGCGERLRKAREAAGLSIAEVGARLKMPGRVVESLENEDWDRLGAPVFVRGQLRSYSRLLGLSTGTMQAAASATMIEPVALAPRTYTPPMQRFAEHAARRLVYIVITAAIAVPAWLATQNHLKAPTQDAAPLDPVSSTGQALPANSSAVGALDLTARAQPAATEPATLIASITPMPQRSAAAPVLSLTFNGESWMQVMAPDGRIIEKSLVPAGQQRSYAAGEVGRVVLGNASAVAVHNRGQVFDLTPYLHANVARFTVSSDGSLTPVAN